MARGSTFASIQSAVRAELRRANSPDDAASVMRTINHVYRVLFYKNDWPFLKRQFAPMPLAAGQQFYDFPSGLDPDRVIEAKVFWSDLYADVERGISFDDYNSFSTPLDERTDPIMKWDVKFTGTREQIEVWPLPASNDQTLTFRGITAMSALVNDTDPCLLEDEIVILFAAAELLPKDAPDKDAKLQMANELLRLAKVRGQSAGDRVFTNGGSDASRRVHPRAIVRIGG